MDTTKMQPLEEWEIEQINPGIRHTVQKLREWGFDTVDSGDGKTSQYECDMEYPYVHILTDPETMASETDRLVSLLEKSGICFNDCPHPQDDPVGCGRHPSVQATYVPPFAAIHVMNVIIPEHE